MIFKSHRLKLLIAGYHNLELVSPIKFFVSSKSFYLGKMQG